MNAAEIKLDLFRKLDSLKDSGLNEAYGLLTNFINSKSDVNDWNNLTEQQQNAIRQGIKQLDNGEGKSHKDVMTDFRKRHLDA